MNWYKTWGHTKYWKRKLRQDLGRNGVTVTGNISSVDLDQRLTKIRDCWGSFVGNLAKKWKNQNEKRLVENYLFDRELD